MAGYYDFLYGPGPLIYERRPQYSSTHYKTDALPFPGEDVPRVDEHQLRGLLDQPYDPAQDFTPDYSTVMPEQPMLPPPSSGMGLQPQVSSSGLDPSAAGTGLQLPPNAGETFGAGPAGMSAAGMNFATNLGMSMLADSLTPKTPQYAPAAPGYRPGAVSIDQLLKLYGMRG